MIIESIKERAKLNKKKIILPEINDERVLEAASIITKEDIADIIMIGNEDEINKAKNKFNLDKVSFINPNTFPYIDKLINTYYEERKHKGISFEEAVNTIKKGAKKGLEIASELKLVLQMVLLVGHVTLLLMLLGRHYKLLEIRLLLNLYLLSS